MIANILEVSNVSKSYKSYPSQWTRIFSWFGFAKSTIQEHQTLKNINFDIKPGESVGIIGQNGAGKSTLLKIITGTLKPTTGTSNSKGRISAILELGMGFHPELTGRQNAYNSAGLMGFTNEQIDSVIDDIESFAEIGEYFHQPVRLYSSGMHVRVAFAVATAFIPDILIVDEALSVGDSYFQHKCFERIKQYRETGMSLLFVSHDKGAVLALCNKAILLDQGSIIKIGNPEETIDYYNALISQKENSSIVQQELGDGKISTVSGTSEATLNGIELLNVNNEKVEVLNVGDTVTLHISVKVNEDLPTLVLGYGIKDRLGQVMFGTNTWLTDQVLSDVKKGEIYDFYITFDVLLGIADYSIQTAIVDSDTHLTSNYEWKDLALMFSVVNANKNHFVGLMWNEPKITISRQ
ncbi:lipopolysaccharide transport system ATP-binding protein [Epsilonproteobacteria bacterium SCGC AD-308-E02]|jgi:lipopolysaccharide transport system ATP-binding protein|nr:lipopolysaccharide transport system ATP-binding protein [Epsilonproteobacteria bacterium SCGC AD-308-E02]